MRSIDSTAALVVAERLFLGVERNIWTKAIRDVGQMAQGGRIMPFQDVGVEVLDLAAADGRDEVAKVLSAGTAAPTPA